MEAVKILMIPGNTNSHLIFFSRLGEGLAKLGHKVELLMPSNSKMYAKLSPYQTKNYNITRYPVMDDEPYINSKESSEALLNIAYTKSDIQKLIKMAEYMELVNQGYERDCVSLIDNRELFNRLMQSGFQIVISDPFNGQYCYYMIPHMLAVPYATFSVPFWTEVYRVPRLHSIVPVVGTGMSGDNMCFRDRFFLLWPASWHICIVKF